MIVSASVATKPAATATPRLLLSLNTRPKVNSRTPFCTLRAAIAATNAFLVLWSSSYELEDVDDDSVVVSVKRPSALRLVELDEVPELFSMGSP